MEHLNEDSADALGEVERDIRIAADLPVSHSMVSRIRLGLSWRNEAEALGWIVERAAA